MKAKSVTAPPFLGGELMTHDPIQMVRVSNRIMAWFLWLGNLKWNLRKYFVQKFKMSMDAIASVAILKFMHKIFS